ncbi:hypothetical protein JCM8208_002821, partial [Rhodotorula glutinis]
VVPQPPAAPTALGTASLPAYTDQDDAVIVSHMQASHDYKTIALALGRSAQSVARRVSKKRSLWVAQGRNLSATARCPTPSSSLVGTSAGPPAVGSVGAADSSSSSALVVNALGPSRAPPTALSATRPTASSAAPGVSPSNRPFLAAAASTSAFSTSALLHPPPPDLAPPPSAKRPRFDLPSLSAPLPPVGRAVVAPTPAPAPVVAHAGTAAATTAVALSSRDTSLDESVEDPWARYERAMAALRELGDF